MRSRVPERSLAGGGSSLAVVATTQSYSLTCHPVSQCSTIPGVIYRPTGKGCAMDSLMIEAHGLTKRFGSPQAPVWALNGIDLAVPQGAILGLLGPNGAGKTTAARILTTLTLPDAGEARVAGHDVLREPGEVRRRIGVTAQDHTLDENLTGRQNLVMVAELSGLRRPD